MKTPELSIIIPVYNRGELIRYTLESVGAACGGCGLQVETIVVDDGSTENVRESLQRIGHNSPTVIRQSNQGLLYARLRGLAEAKGEYVLFLDSDDLIAPEKLTIQLAETMRNRVDVSYCDSATVVLEGDFQTLRWTPQERLGTARDAADLYVRLQPAPHSPIFASAYLKNIVDKPLFAASPNFNPVAEIWFYYVASIVPANVLYTPGFFSATGVHGTERLSGKWERLGVASLGVMEQFAEAKSGDAESASNARQLVSEAAFRAWRALPKGINSTFADRFLHVSRKLGAPRGSEVGGKNFQRLSRLTGVEMAGKLFALSQRKPYNSVRTMSDDEFNRLLSQLEKP